MTALIKKMLAERAARERAMTCHSEAFDEGVARIKRAASWLDASFDSKNKWKPSEALLIGYCALATSARPESADELLNERLAQWDSHRMAETVKQGSVRSMTGPVGEADAPN